MTPTQPPPKATRILEARAYPSGTPPLEITHRNLSSALSAGRYWDRTPDLCRGQAEFMKAFESGPLHTQPLSQNDLVLDR